MLGVEIPEDGEHAEPEAEGHEPEANLRAKGGLGRKKGTAKPEGPKPLPPEFKDKYASASSGWNSAIGTVDGQVDALGKAMAKHDDPDIKAIAKHALAGVTGGYKQLFAAYLKAVGDGSDAAAVRKEGPGLLGAVADLRTTIEKDRQVAVMDDNPFGVAVSIKGTLGPALNELEAALRLGLA